MENSRFYIVFTLVLLKCTTLCPATNFLNSSTDEDALLAFKASVTSDPYGILANNWSTVTSICYWIGVSCGIKHQRVTTLNFSSFHLRGTVAPHLGNLTFLRSLDISFNNFTGIIPDTLSNLRRLKEINVGFNSLTGQVPSWFGSLNELHHIHLNNNTFTGRIPSSLFNSTSKLLTLDMGYNFLGGIVPQEIGNFSSLETLNLEFNQFTVGSFPYSIFKVSSIRTINLRKCRLSGTLPSDMCNNITRLKMLYLSHNQLYGDIPPNIYKCRDLEDLRLQKNHFSGDIPSEIGSLVNLKILYLWSNNFGGDIPTQLGNLTSLNSIHLGGNKLTGGIPKQLGNITSLKRLELPQNKLTGELPQELSNLAYLEVFDVGNNSLSSSIPSFMFNISTLKIMSLQWNHFSGRLPSTIGMEPSLFNLEKLYLDNNRLSGAIPSYINNASKLTLLQMQVNSFSGPVPNFGNLRLLERLRIWENNLTGGLRFFTSLSNCRYLQVLQVSRNPLNGDLPRNLSTSLQLFRASECNITGAIPSEIGNLTGLQVLALYSNQLTGFIPTTLGKLKQLEGIYLHDNRLQGFIPPDLCQMNNLVEFYVNGNMLIGPIPECLGELTSLRIVYLSSNNLNSTIPSSFWNLADLLHLNLSSNNLSGQLSLDIGSLKVFNALDLSSNQFSGDIPSSISSSQSMVFLSLAHNKFEGSIPKSLGNIISLEYLDLSNNNLSGGIPKSLEGLDYLQYFNVSYNKLDGEIPTRGPFVNFTGESFVQNSALCGAARFHVRLCVHTHKRSRPKNFSTLLVKYILPPIVSTIILAIIIIVLIRRRRRKQNKVLPPTNISLNITWRRISYEELVHGTNVFSETNLLGRGGFGSVFRGILSDGLNVAIKVFNLQREGASKSFDTESEILSTVRHRNLVRIIGCCCNTEFKALILAYMPNGSLEKWLYSESYCLDVLQRVKIAIDVALGLEYLHHGHTFPVVHCDIKPSNILLDEDMIAHVADFGISKLFDDGEVVIQTNTLATIGYTAPEYGSEGKVSTNGDVYSYGILLLEMFTRKKPTDDMFSEEMSLKNWVGEALLKENAVNEVVAPGLLTREDQHFLAKEQCVSSVFGLAMKCVAFSPEERINTLQIVAALQKIKTKFVASNKMC